MTQLIAETRLKTFERRVSERLAEGSKIERWFVQPATDDVFEASNPPGVYLAVMIEMPPTLPVGRREVSVS